MNLICSGVARNFSQGVRNFIVSNLQPTPFTVSVESGTFDSRTRHLLSHFLNRNLTEVAEMHRGEHTAAHCWWQYALLQLCRRRTQQVYRRLCQLWLTQAFVTHVTRLMKITTRARGHTIFDLNDPLL